MDAENPTLPDADELPCSAHECALRALSSTERVLLLIEAHVAPSVELIAMTEESRTCT